jgi:hypothetical protein
MYIKSCPKVRPSSMASLRQQFAPTNRFSSACECPPGVRQVFPGTDLCVGCMLRVTSPSACSTCYYCVGCTCDKKKEKPNMNLSATLMCSGPASINTMDHNGKRVPVCVMPAMNTYSMILGLAIRDYDGSNNSQIVSKLVVWVDISLSMRLGYLQKMQTFLVALVRDIPFGIQLVVNSFGAQVACHVNCAITEENRVLAIAQIAELRAISRCTSFARLKASIQAEYNKDPNAYCAVITDGEMDNGFPRMNGHLNTGLPHTSFAAIAVGGTVHKLSRFVAPGTCVTNGDDTDATVDLFGIIRKRMGLHPCTFAANSHRTRISGSPGASTIWVQEGKTRVVTVHCDHLPGPVQDPVDVAGMEVKEQVSPVEGMTVTIDGVVYKLKDWIAGRGEEHDSMVKLFLTTRGVARMCKYYALLKPTATKTLRTECLRGLVDHVESYNILLSAKEKMAMLAALDEAGQGLQGCALEQSLVHPGKVVDHGVSTGHKGYVTRVRRTPHGTNPY